MLGLNARRIFYIVVLVVIGFVASQYIPALFNSLQFNDFIRQEVKFAGTSRKTTDDVVRDIMEKAKEFQIPVTAKDVRITRRGPSFTLDLEYDIPVDLRVYRHVLRFHASENGESFDK